MNTLSRRYFLRTSGAAIGAALVPSIVVSGAVRAAANERIPKIWNSAEILVGNSLAEQNPGPAITCPFFFANGHFANASHTLDLSALPGGGPIKGEIAWGGDAISPDFSRSIATTMATGSDGNLYLLTAGEAEVSGGQGHFSGIKLAIVRCKYKAVLDGRGFPLLVACAGCVAILVRS